MKKILALLLAAIMVMSFAACSSNKPADPQKPDSSRSDTVKPNDGSKPDVAKTATPKEIEAAIAKALGEGYLATIEVPEDEMWSSAISRLDLTKVKTYVAKQAENVSLDMDAVVIAECEDGYADEAVKQLNESFAQTVDYIRQYPFGVAKVEGARLYKIGNTVMLIIAGASADENASAEDEAKLAASEYEKIDNAIKALFGTLPENLAVIPEATDNGGSDEGDMILGG